jgi:hypothetical protein
MRKVYVAGPISANDPITLFGNEKNGIDTSAWLLLQGFAVFCPHLDFQYLLGVYGKDITKELLQANSMAFVECCDAMLVLPGWGNSIGASAEIERAIDLGIPIYFNVHELVEKEK